MDAIARWFERLRDLDFDYLSPPAESPFQLEHRDPVNLTSAAYPATEVPFDEGHVAAALRRFLGGEVPGDVVADWANCLLLFDGFTPEPTRLETEEFMGLVNMIACPEVDGPLTRSTAATYLIRLGDPGPNPLLN